MPLTGVPVTVAARSALKLVPKALAADIAGGLFEFRTFDVHFDQVLATQSRQGLRDAADRHVLAQLRATRHRLTWVVVQVAQDAFPRWRAAPLRGGRH